MLVSHLLAMYDRHGHCLRTQVYCPLVPIHSSLFQLILDLDYVFQEWLTEMSPPEASGFSPIPALPWSLDRNHYVLAGCPLFLKPVP